MVYIGIFCIVSLQTLCSKLKGTILKISFFYILGGNAQEGVCSEINEWLKIIIQISKQPDIFFFHGWNILTYAIYEISLYSHKIKTK